MIATWASNYFQIFSAGTSCSFAVCNHFFFSVRLPVSEATGKWLLYCIFHILSASLITVKVSLIFHFARLLVLCSLRCAIKKATSFLSKRDQQLLFVILLLVQLLQVVTFFNLSLEILEYCSLAHFIWNRLRLGSERIEHRFIITFSSFWCKTKYFFFCKRVAWSRGASSMDSLL